MENKVITVEINQEKFLDVISSCIVWKFRLLQNRGRVDEIGGMVWDMATTIIEEGLEEYDRGKLIERANTRFKSMGIDISKNRIADLIKIIVLKNATS